jgi:hypothetical protein
MISVYGCHESIYSIPAKEKHSNRVVLAAIYGHRQSINDTRTRNRLASVLLATRGEYKAVLEACIADETRRSGVFSLISKLGSLGR